ncbi:MAG: hypothetical protein DRI40_08315 [Chloroflexi bacterium]|nr:MAG: hypothetical protein DRI40_08315 [Chloroflexota bacterium]
MWVTVLVLAGVVAVTAILLVVPVDVDFSVERETDFRSRARVKWMFGLIGKEIGGRRNEKKGKQKEHRLNLRSLLAAMTTGGFPHKLLAFAKDAARALKIRELEANLRVGLGDPAETGMLFSAIAPTMFFIRSWPSVDVNVEPDFEQKRFQGYCKGAIRTIPLSFARAFIPFVFSKTTIRAFRAMLRDRRV